MRLLKIKWKNLLSYGDDENFIDFQDASVNLVTGKNGLGKSTAILESVCFLFYGKPYRNDLNKNDIVNDINDKDLLVEGELQIGNDLIKIRRGLKPGIFEIFKNEILIPQNSATRDYQKILEEDILRMDIHTFKQIIIISTMDYTPFLKLKSYKRREFIENILNLTLFSQMNELNKSKTNSLKNEIQLLYSKQEMIEKSIEIYDNAISLYSKESSDNIKDLNSEIDIIQNDIKELNYDSDLHKDLEKSLSKIIKKNEALKSIQNNLEKNKNRFSEELLSVCPVCKKENNIHDEKKKEIESKIQEIEESQKNNENEISEYQELFETLKENKEKLDMKLSSLKEKQRQIEYLENKKEKLIQKQKSCEDLKEIEKTVEKTKEQYKENKENISIKERDLKERSIISELLKDSGIKSKLLSRYIPLLNGIINEYLNLLDFNFEFTFNEFFEETIRSYDGISRKYSLFSAGQQQRIDLALLFAWRKISSLLHSCNFNFVVLDEVFSASLDQDGVESMKKILKSLDNVTVFLISHNQDVQNDLDFFDNIYNVNKKGNFSYFSLYIN